MTGTTAATHISPDQPVQCNNSLENEERAE
ncbi:hypothetical protein GCWB2_04065 [Gordonia rubripertincta]|nr:hypothetical protein GCWB2_04065 [Gordonia rubripertincta]